MRKSWMKLIALCLTAALLFTGCGLVPVIEQALLLVKNAGQVHYRDMEYTRPDLEQMQDTLQECYRLLLQDDVKAALDSIYQFYAFYDHFSTCYALANIRYSCDLTDTYWEQEYNFCAE